MKLVIPGRLPGLNEYTKACNYNRFKGAKMKREVEEVIQWEIKRQLKGKKFKCIKLVFRWIEPNMRRDKDNIATGKKFILDSMQKAGTLANDGWSQIAKFEDEFEVDKANPRVVVEIEEVA